MSDPRAHNSRAVAGCRCDGCERVRVADNARRNALRAKRRADRPPAPPKPRNQPPPRGIPEVDPAEWEHLRVGLAQRPAPHAG